MLQSEQYNMIIQMSLFIFIWASMNHDMWLKTVENYIQNVTSLEFEGAGGANLYANLWAMEQN